MQDLRLVAANERGTHLVLRSPDGDKFLLSIDDRLRAAVRGDRIRLGQLDSESEGQLRPRDIQARIRAGASADQVARTAGVPVDRVRRFEGPVLAEREHMAQMAQRSAVRRPGQPEARPTTLGEALPVRLDAIKIKPEDLDWDSWRRDDGRWVVQLAYDDEETHLARFVYDAGARTVVAENDEARWLTGELEQRPQRGPFVPRFADSPDAAAADDSNDLDALAAEIGAFTPEPPAAATVRRPDPTVDRRPPDVVARRPEPTSAPSLPKPPATVVIAPPAAKPIVPPIPAAPAASAENPGRHRSAGERPIPELDEPEVAQSTGTADPRPAAPRTGGGRSRRASVPSWDDILFGARGRD